MESRMRLFDFDNCGKEDRIEKEERDECNRGGYYFVLISAARQGMLQDTVSNKQRDSYDRRRSELNGIEEQTI